MSNGTAKLKFGEIKKLQKILDKSHEIHGKGNFPTIEVEPTALIKVMAFFGIVKIEEYRASCVFDATINLNYDNGQD